MSLKIYFYIWVIISALMGLEYWALDHNFKFSLMHIIQDHLPGLRGVSLSTASGRPISYVLGWVGMGLIATTQLYVFRKKVLPLNRVGSLAGWLNFHIFCGLLGPTFILFHSDFKVHGLVGISFWSMIIVVISGFVGQYIYVQILQQKMAFNSSADLWSKKIEAFRQESQPPISPEAVESMKATALQFVGLSSEVHSVSTLPQIFMGAIMGDIRLLFTSPIILPGMPKQSRYALAQYAIMRRRTAFLESFRIIFGYWHTLHLPFTFFMYGVAIIHIAAALIFKIAN